MKGVDESSETSNIESGDLVMGKGRNLGEVRLSIKFRKEKHEYIYIRRSE